ncbi:SDR family oxidoreductase [Thermomonas brevis]|uniref:SDR family oxidoreductase n=1 Tax=Thermomonas brevis TaxID=215691 RepID=A0A7G9QT66_9GAMM|nr:SDR family oxidoreductase [Thermomonas brevis]QNN46541.1 SDR family oxidoreductase [Thermomonas brevis]
MHMLKDKVALITGASSGIGHATARLFARHGARLVIAGRDAARLAALKAQIEEGGGQALALAGDVRDEAHARALVEAAVDAFDGLDIAFNNAGDLGPMGPTSEVALEDWRHALDVNLTAAFLGAKHQLPALVERGGGALIFTGTFVGHTVGFSGMAAYAASKAGVIGLTKALAAEYGGRNVRVNALLPGGTDTPMGRAVADSPEAVAHVRSLHALERMATPEEIAGSALYLASDLGSFTTGVTLLADGGVSVKR